VKLGCSHGLKLRALMVGFGKLDWKVWGLGKRCMNESLWHYMISECLEEKQNE